MLSSDDVNSMMDEHITKVINANGDVVPQIAARVLAESLRDSNPELLVSWVDLHAEDFLADYIRARIRSSRSKQRTRAKAARFEAASDEFVRTGDAQKFLGSFDVRCSVDDSGTQRRVGDMTGNDHKYVASRYELTAKRSKMLASFHRAVAAQLGDKKVSDMFTEEQYVEMFRSIVS